MLIPCPANRYQLDHAERLRNSFHTLTGRYLIEPALSPENRKQRRARCFTLRSWSCHTIPRLIRS